MNIEHTWIGDLRIKLISPNGKETILHDFEGSSSDNIAKVYQLDSFIGEKSYGSWKLVVVDKVADDVGHIQNWKLNISL